MNFYEDSLTYLMNDMLVKAYDFKVIKEAIKQIMEKLPKKPYELVLIIVTKLPSIESPLVERFLDEGKVKSYQKKEICLKLKEVIKGKLNTHLESSLNRFSKLKNCSTMKLKTAPNEFRVFISVRNLDKFTPKLLYAVINHFNVNALGYCDKVEVILSVAQTKGSSLEVILKEELPSVSASRLSKFVTLSDKEKVLNFFGCPEVKEILFTHFFPHGLENDQLRTEVTYDQLREETVAQKRRKVLLPSGEYENLHDAITPFITHEEFLQIVDINNILGFYPSVRTTNTQEVVTAMIDIDVSNFLRTSFSPSVVWELVIALTEEIVKNLTEFLRLPVPLVAFSGSRGVHLTYRLAIDSVSADLNYVDYSELYLLPSQKSLAKNNRSLIHDKFIFIRTLMQAILLYTAQNISREKIPKTIQESLGIVRIMDLFTLSVFSRNKIGVLLDTSSNNSSVYRVFSIHPTTGLVSIPLLDPKTKKIRNELKSYSALKEACKPGTVVNNLREGKKDIYFQFPPEINKAQIKYLLRPDKLLPTLSVIVRFSDRYATERSPWSMKFWLEMYQLNNFYGYLMAKMLSIERSDNKIGTSYQEIAELIDHSEVNTKKFAKEVVDDYFFRNISFKTLKARLDAFHDLDFYTSFKFTEITALSPERINHLFSNIRDRNMFFHKFTSFFNISLVLLSYYAKRESRIEPRLRQSIEGLTKKARALNQEVTSIKLAKNNDKKLIVKKTFAQIVCLFNILSNFIKEVVGRDPV